MGLNGNGVTVSIIYIGFTSIRNVEFKKRFAFKEHYSKEKIEKILDLDFPPIKKINFLYYEENGILLNGNDDLNTFPN